LGLNLALIPEDFIPQCLDALKAVSRAAGTQPTPYYALVQMDGDHMGTILSNVSGTTQHSNMSKSLSMFARKHAPEIVQEAHPGRLVYAGGDDVLALTPLDGMLTMIDALQQRYRKTVAPVVPDVSKKTVTASMGIAIGHHFTPLSVVRRASLEAEKLAKNRYGRNAFVVTLLRRSGEQTRVGCQWEYPSLTFTPIQLFQHFYTYFLYDVFSPKSIHVLLSEVSALLGLQIPAQRSEIRRVLTRQLNEHLDDQQLKLLIGEVDQQLSKEQKAERIAKKNASLAEQIVALAAAMDQEMEIRRTRGEKMHISMELSDDTLRCGLVETLGWLLVMAFLAREGWEA
jgi:CRISPR-associated protein Cmr2